MSAIAEEVKRATEMEAGDLAIEVTGKTIRVYEIVGGSKLKQIAYSDTFQRDRFIMFHEPSEEMQPAKDFTTARLYRKPEIARKAIAKYFPKYARAGAKAHLYYSGAGPRGRSPAMGKGYFSVPLAGPMEGLDELKGIPKPKKFKVNKTSREFKMGQRAFEQNKPNAPALNKKLMLSFKGKTSDQMMQMMTDYASGWHTANLAAPVPEGLDEVKVRTISSPKGSALMFMPVRLMPYWWTGSKWSDKKDDARYYEKSGAKAELGNARVAAQKLVKRLKESDMNERYDPQLARDYVKGIKDRKRKAYAREYLKAISGIRMPPSPEEFKITTQAAREVEKGFKRIGAPLAASVHSTDPTFEQIARIVRRAKSGGFNPSRISLAERAIPTTDADYIFIIHHETDDSYSVAHSVHGDPRLGYQELQTGLDKRAAEKMVRKLKTRWKKARVRRFLLTGYGHKREWLPESNAEKAKRIKADVDGEINDPKNKGLTIAQTLLAMFGMDVDEAKKLRLDWRPYPLKDGVASKTWKEIYSPEGKKLGHVVPYKYGRGWNAYAVDGRKAKVLKNKAAVEAFFLKEDADEARKRVVVSKLKDEVNYQRSEDSLGDARCGNCAFIIMPDACQRVRGKIDQDFICDLFKRGIAEDLDEAGAQGKVQKDLLHFVEQLPPNSEFWLADVTKRQEFKRVHFKRLMSAAKALEKKGRIWYDGMSAVGPLKA